MYDIGVIGSCPPTTLLNHVKNDGLMPLNSGSGKYVREEVSGLTVVARRSRIIAGLSLVVFLLRAGLPADFTADKP